MKDQEVKRLKAGTARAALVLVGLLALAFGAGGALRAQEAPATNSPIRASRHRFLDYQDANYSCMNWPMPVVVKLVPFKKEPPFGRGKVIRGTLQMAGGVNDEMAFAWDRGAGKLYLDLNRNLDLTDDPAGVYSSPRGSLAMSQTFPGVRLPVKAGGATRSMLADLTFYDYGSGPNCTAALRSFWQGKLTLQGEEWQVGLLGNPFTQASSFNGSSLLLRPWAERNKPLNLNGGSLETVPFSERLFFGNRAYRLQCSSEVPGDSEHGQIQFKEQSPKLGELRSPVDLCSGWPWKAGHTWWSLTIRRRWSRCRSAPMARRALMARPKFG